MTRSLVTGGAGFIGSHLVDALVAVGDEVTVIDSFATGRRENLAHHAAGRVRVVEADVADGAAIRPAFVGVDRVFHLAALADIVPSVERPLEYHHANVDGTVAVLEAARAAGVKRFVYTASSSCYGLPDAFPTPETAPARPQYPYALTKYLGEQYVMHWSQLYRLPAVSCRLFNVYGPRSRTTGAYGAVFGVFLAQKLAERPFTVVGDGTQTRDFTYVADVVAALVAASQSNLSGEILNVGTGEPQSVNRLCELIGGAVEYIPHRPGEPARTQADATRARTLLGWRPRVTFEDGVRTMLAQIERWRDAPVWTAASIAEATKPWFDALAAQEKRG